MVQLLPNLPSPTALRQRHIRKERCQPHGRKAKLVHHNPLEGRHRPRLLCEREVPRQELEPLELEWRDDESPCCESGQSGKVKGRGEDAGGRDQFLAVAGKRRFGVEVVELDGEVVVAVDAAGLADGALADGGDGLGDGVGDAVEDAVGDHHSDDGAGVKVGVVATGDATDEGHFFEENEKVDEGLLG